MNSIQDNIKKLNHVRSMLEQYEFAVAEVYEMLGDLYNEDDYDPLNETIKTMMRKLEEI